MRALFVRGGGGAMTIEEIMQQAQSMQQRMLALQERLGKELVSAGTSDRVRVEMTCRKSVQKINIGEQWWRDSGPEDAAKHILARLNEAEALADARLSNETERMMADLGLPENFSLPGSPPIDRAKTLAAAPPFKGLNVELAPATRFDWHDDVDPERAAEGKLVLGAELAEGYSATRELLLGFYARAASAIEYTSASDPSRRLYVLAEGGGAASTDQGNKFRTLLDGRSEPLHAANVSLQADLTDHVVNVPAYVRFFCATVFGEAGPFVVVDDIDRAKALIERMIEIQSEGMEFLNPEARVQHIEHYAREMREHPDLVQDKVPPLEVYDQTSEGGWLLKAWIVYGAGLFETIFTVSLAGEIHMLEDSPIWAMPLPDNAEG